MYRNQKPIMFIYMYVTAESAILKEINATFYPFTVIIQNGTVNRSLD